MTEIPIEEKSRNRGLTALLAILAVLLVAGAVWYFALGAPGLATERMMEDPGEEPRVEDVRGTEPVP